MTIKLNDDKNLKAFITLLYKFGYAHYQGLNLERCIENYKDSCYSHFTLNTIDKTFWGKKMVNFLEYETQLPEIVELLTNPEKVIKISGVGDYEAIVSKTGVEVGCQTITPEKVVEIYNALQSLKTLS